jgi:Cof subfamily protein (haloacid dehalogenase superfamily)
MSSGPDSLLPADVRLIACDLDGTLLAADLVIRERTRAAIAAAQAAGIHVVIVTGRMYQSALPYARAAGLEGPLICYQGAAVVDPATGDYLLHEPIPVPLAREAIAEIEATGHTLNVYVDDELYVAKLTAEAERYATFQHLEIHPIGDLLGWLERPPTKLVSVGEPDAMDALKEHMLERFGDRLHISKSLAIFLELSRKGITKGSGTAFLATRLGVAPEQIVAIGDAENDVELLQYAGCGVCVASGDPNVLALADLACPGPDEEGPAQVIEAIVGGRRTLAP